MLVLGRDHTLYLALYPVYIQGTGTRTHTRTPARMCTRLVRMYIRVCTLHAALVPSASLYTGHAAWSSCHFSIVDIHELEQLIPKKRSVMAKRSENEKQQRTKALRNLHTESRQIYTNCTNFTIEVVCTLESPPQGPAMSGFVYRIKTVLADDKTETRYDNCV